MKRISKIVVLFALLLIFGAVSAGRAPVEAADEVPVSGLWVGDSAEVTEEGEIPDTGGTGTASVSTEDGSVILTLDYFSYTGEGHAEEDGMFKSAIRYTGSAPLIIVAQGDNFITQTGNSGYYSRSMGIYSDSRLTFTGSDDLFVYSGDAESQSFAIYSGDSVHVRETMLSAFSGSANDCYGIYGYRGVVITDADVFAEAANTIGNYSKSYGISSSDFTGEDIWITGSIVEAISGNVRSGDAVSGNNSFITSAIHGVSSTEIHIINSTVTATAGDTEGEYCYSYGICSEARSVEIESGTVTASAGTQAISACGDTRLIFIREPIVDILTGDEAPGSSTSRYDARYGSYKYAYLSDTFSFLDGSGTEEHPYIISNREDWDTLASHYVNSMTNGFYYCLSDDFDNSDDPVTVPLGSAGTEFTGVFDGKGRTLTVALSGGEMTAPFSKISNLTVKNLTVDGSIQTTGKFAGGLASNANGDNHIENCFINAEIESDVSGDGTHGGMVGRVQGGTTAISDSVFAGKLLGSNTTNCGGFVGWADSSNNAKVEFANVLFHPAEVTVSGDGSCTFARAGNTSSVLYDHAFYLEELGTAQGVQAYEVLPEGVLGAVFTAADGNEYYAPASVSGIGQVYFYTGEPIAMDVVVAAPDGTPLAEGVDYEVTTDPSPVIEPGDYVLTVTGIGDYTGSVSSNFRIIPTYEYLKLDGEMEKTEGEVTILGAEDLVWDTDWIVADGTVTIGGRVRVDGSVNLLLADGCSLTIPRGITVEGDNSLTIWGQTNEDGRLTINSVDNNNAGIGSTYNKPSGMIRINGGTVKSEPGSGAAAIGGGRFGTGTVEINAGTVDLYMWGGLLGAGIGGGYGYPGFVTINGGSVNIENRSYGAGIGNGRHCDDEGEVLITGGNVVVRCTAYDGAAIGGGAGTEAFSSEETVTEYKGTVTITGGTVTATGYTGAGIGSGYKCTGGTVTITGGTVEASSASGSGIGNGKSSEGAVVHLGWTEETDSITSASYSGTVTLDKDFTDGENSYAAGEVEDNAILAGKTLTPPPVLPQFDTRQLILSGQIGMNFFMKMSEVYAGGTMTFAIGDRTDTAVGTLQADGRYLFTCYLTAIEMAEEITAVYTDEAGEHEVSMTTSIKEYLEELIANPDNREDVARAIPLAKAIYNYGHYASKGLPGGAKHPQMPDTYANEADLVDELSGYDLIADLDRSVITAGTFSLSLDSETTMNFYLTTGEVLTKDNVTVESEDTSFSYTVAKDGKRYRVKITGIAAHELGIPFTVRTGESTITASALTYVQNCLASSKTKQATKDLAAALYNYYCESIAYAG